MENYFPAIANLQMMVITKIQIFSETIFRVITFNSSNSSISVIRYTIIVRVSQINLL